SVAAGTVIIWYGGRQILIEHSMNASAFLSFLFIIFQIMPPVKELTNVNNRIQEASAAGERIFEILDRRPSIGNAPNAVQLVGLAEGIEFANVSFSYDGDDPVLTDVNLAIRKGEVVAIVGPSGTGKTTLVDLLPRFYDPTGGGIAIDGIDLRTIDLRSLRR